MATICFTLIIILFCILNPIVDGKCKIDVNKDYNTDSPLILNKNTLDTIYPNKNSPNILIFKMNQEFLLQCTGGQLTRNNISIGSISEVSKCISNLKFTNFNKSLDYSFPQIGCSKNPNLITKEDSTVKCGKYGTIVKIGYQITKSIFKKIIDLCFVESLATTLWSHSKIPGAIGGNKNRDSYASTFSKGSYFKNVSMSQVYRKSNQQQTFMEIFDGNKSLVDQYLPQIGKEKNYFVKGHLVARADMFYYSEQYSTFSYLNALPMWQSINNRNWKSVESIVRRTATFEGDLDVWTGGLGVLKLNNKDIYLTKDKNNGSKMLIPAPKLLFKVVSNGEKNEAIVFLTVNDPYVDEREQLKEYRVCKEYEVCTQKYVQFNQSVYGYTYCCLLDDFLEVLAVRELGIPVNLNNAKVLTLR